VLNVGKGCTEERRSLSPASVYQSIVRHYGQIAGVDSAGFCTHSLCAAAATNALDHQADIAKVQEWHSHANIHINDTAL
jgi:site-specific recombinase XerD